MASIRNRSGRWQARVIRKGQLPEVKTFGTRQDAERWARSIEVAIDRGCFRSRESADSMTLGQVIERYIEAVLPSMRGERDDRIRLLALHRHRLSSVSMVALTPTEVGAYRDERLRSVKPATVVRELAYLSAVINHARREWGINCSNPVSSVRKPPQPPGRDRLLGEEEHQRLIDALKPIGRRNNWMQPLVTLALETAMRRGELLSLRWDRVNLEARVAHLETTKNGDRRAVPLSSKAAGVLQHLPHSDCGRVFPITVAAVQRAFTRGVERAGIRGLRFHDLRHTAITAMASKLPNVIELSAVTGHRSLRMLQRYYHPKAEELALKLG